MSKLKPYNTNFSPNALRVRAVIQELGLDVEIIEVNLREGENQTDALFGTQSKTLKFLSSPMVISHCENRAPPMPT